MMDEAAMSSSTIECPRCKTENSAERSFCHRCGMGLRETGTLPSPSSWDGEEWVGKIVGEKYRILSVLGEGGFGIVFKVQLTLFDDQGVFALKMLRPALSENDQFRRRFLREVRTAMELVHPYAIPVRDFGQTESGLLYFTMDYCAGEPLQAVLAREGYLTVNRAIPLAIQMLEVMDAAHSRDIIHRDLKPDNVFLERDSLGREHVRVADFGLAKSIVREGANGRPPTDITQGGIVGTPRYMSPEQARGEPLDARSDLYSIGVVLFEMLAGELPPRPTGNRGGILAGGPGALTRLRAEFPPNLVIPRGVLQVLARALQEKPADRYQSAREFKDALEVLPNYTPTYIEPPLPGPARSPRRMVAMLSVILLLGVSFFLPPVKQKASDLWSSFTSDSASAGDKKVAKITEEGPQTKPNSSEKDHESRGEGGVDPSTQEKSGDEGSRERALAHVDQGEAKHASGRTEEPQVDRFPTQGRLGPLSSWIALEDNVTLRFRTTVFDGEPQVVEETFTVQPGTPAPDDPEESTHTVDYACGDVRSQEEWKASATRFEPARVIDAEEGRTRPVWTIAWDQETERPAEQWTSHDGRYQYRTEFPTLTWVGPARFEESLLVVAETDNGLEKRLYLVQGKGLVKVVVRQTGDEPRLLLTRERVL